MFEHAYQIFAFGLLASLSLCGAQVTTLGPCPSNIKTVENFDAPRYLGKWYEYAKYPFIFELNAKCVTAQYGVLSDEKISVYNQQISKLTGNKDSILGSATVQGPGKLSVHFDVAPVNAPYWVLGTDYDKWAVAYSCSDFRVFHTTVIWILTRESEPSAESVHAAENAITSNGLSLQPLIKTEQADCGN